MSIARQRGGGGGKVKSRARGGGGPGGDRKTDVGRDNSDTATTQLWTFWMIRQNRTLGANSCTIGWGLPRLSLPLQVDRLELLISLMCVMTQKVPPSSESGLHDLSTTVGSHILQAWARSQSLAQLR